MESELVFIENSKSVSVNRMRMYDVAVIGGGPAGCMAAIQNAKYGGNIILLEKNDSIGCKLLLTGNGRCNITNTADLEVFIDKFGRIGSFYRDAFNEFSNHDLIEFFKINGLEFKEEDDGRVFPITDKSESVLSVLKNLLDLYKVELVYNYRLTDLHKYSKVFKLYSEDSQVVTARNVIIATGGASYQFTGSTGDGFKLAELCGHHITELKPGGVPLVTREEWAHKLKGITLSNVGLNLGYGNKLKPLNKGDLLLTHFGVSGPVILDMSQEIIELMNEHGDLKLYIDSVPEITMETLGNLLISDFMEYSKKNLSTYLRNYLPKNMINSVLKTVHLDPEKKLNQITKKERLTLEQLLRALPLTITGHLPLDKAMVTCGGVNQKEINPRTMESKLVDNLYFAGEIIAGCGRRGGYNLQQAFSTGYLAGINASRK